MITMAWLEQAAFVAILGLALVFRPWLPLRHAPLQSPWIGAMVLLPFAWWTQHLLPSGLTLHLSGACLMVLMVGWPLAMWSIAAIAFVADWAAVGALPTWANHVSHALWMGLLPGTLALGLGLLIRRWLPSHLFVYILGRGFFTTALSVSAVGVLAWGAGLVPPALGAEEWLLGHWLLGWGEAISTGMLTAIFVAFKPEWMLTYSDARYLPPPERPNTPG